MQHTPINRIQRVLALAGVTTRRSPRWVEETNAGHIAEEMHRARNALSVR